jgi:hypothetical protein
MSVPRRLRSRLTFFTWQANLLQTNKRCLISIGFST